MVSPAAAEAPHLREPLTDLALELYYQKDWHGVLFAAGRALRITKRPRTYICEADAWGSLPWDLMAVAYYNIGRNTLALEYALQALELDPGNERLQNNVRLLRELEDAAALPPVFRDSNQLPEKMRSKIGSPAPGDYAIISLGFNAPDTILSVRASQNTI